MSPRASSSTKRRVLVAIAAAGLVAAVLPHAAQAKAAAAAAGGPTARYLVSGAPAGAVPTIASTEAGDLADLTAGQAAALRAAGATVDEIPDAHILKLNRAVLDTASGGARAVSALPAGVLAALTRAPAAPTAWALQFAGPLDDSWLPAVQAAGLHPVAHGYLPENGWLVVGQADAVERAKALGFVQAIRPYVAAYRLSPRLDTVVAKNAGPTSVRIQFFENADLAALAGKVQALGATVLGKVDEADVKMLRVSIAPAALVAVAQMADVEWVEPALDLELMNDHAADTMGVRPVWSGVPEAPGVSLQGEGEVVAVADTGLDTGKLATIHPDFKSHIKQLQAWGRPGPNGNILTGDPSDNDGHGTHTSGSVVADGTAWGSVSLTGCTMSCDPTKAPKGLAPKAQLVMQSISGPDDSLTGVPDDPSVLYQAAYDQGARVHSDSYGSDAAGAYDSQSFFLDRFMETHPDILFAFAAGNAGADANVDGITDPGSIGSPATAKSVLAVGASEDQRGASFTSGSLAPGVPAYSTYAVFYVPPAGPPIENDFMSNNKEGMVAFSSRGPTADGRLKPEVTGIGTHVLSTRSSKIAAADIEAHYWSKASSGSSVGNPMVGDYPATLDPYYAFDGGTSMSTPLTAGAATVLREYLRKVRGINDPSAALMTASLTVGAHELQGQYPAPKQDVSARPDNNEGWGRVDVAGSVNPTGGAKNVFVDDATGLRTGAVASYPLVVSNVSVPLRVQLAWTDKAANLTAAKTLVNDLDLVVTAPDGTVYRGNQFGARANGATPSTANATAADHLNVIEGVQVPAAAVKTGTWTVTVKGFSTPGGNQPFAFAAQGGFATTATGALHVDAGAYRSNGRPVTITVNDPARDQAGVANTVPVKVSTTSAPAGVTVTLKDATGKPGAFTGTIKIGAPGSGASATSLPGKDGDKVNVTYVDAGGATRTAMAVVDDRPPVVTNPAVARSSPVSARFTFGTNEPAVGSVRLGATPSATNIPGTDSALTTTHTVDVNGLTPAKRYWLDYVGTDDPGNVGVNNDNGKRYTFRTPDSTLEYTYDAETETGWTHTNNSSSADDQWHLTSRADAVHGGSHAWLFGPEDPTMTYPTSADASLDGPAITRTAAQWANLSFYANYDTEKGFDGVNVLVSQDNGTTYALVPLVSQGPPSGPSLASAQIDGNSGGYRLLTFDLSALTSTTIKIRLQFTSDEGVEKSGFAFDDLTVTGSKPAPVNATITGGPGTGPIARGAWVNAGNLTLTPARDGVRLDTLVMVRGGTATDADVPQARITVPGRAPVVVPIKQGSYVFTGLAWDAVVGTASTAKVELFVAANAVKGRTVAPGNLDTANDHLAAPDTLSPGSVKLRAWTIA